MLSCQERERERDETGTDVLRRLTLRGCQERETEMTLRRAVMRELTLSRKVKTKMTLTYRY